MNEEDFSSELLNLPLEFATRVFENNGGGVTIEQEDFFSADPPKIVLSKSQTEQLYLALQEFVEGVRHGN
jgi:hypothetical protein